MKKTLGLILVAVLAAGLYWRDGLIAATTPYVSGAFAAVSATALPVAPGSGQAAPATSGNRRGAAPTRVATVAAAAEDMPIERRTIGTIASPANLTVTTETSGLVTEVLAADGADVKAGDVLVRLDSRVAEATVEKDRAALARDQATFEHAKETAARQEKLLSNEAVSQQSLEDANAAVETAGATVAVDQATLKSDLVTLDQKTIRAPFDGRLGAVGVVIGSLVQPGTAIVRLTRLDPLYASFALSESDATLVRAARAAGKPIGVSVTPLDTAHAFTGEVDFVDDAVDSTAGTFTARATLHGLADRLVPGQSIAVTAAIGTMPVVGVPTVALQATQQGSVIYVVGDDGTVAVRPVTVALSAGDRSGLSSGVQAGERVVVEGQVRLSEGMKVIDTSSAKVGDAGGKPTDTAEVRP